jgi:hypothetical protein
VLFAGGLAWKADATTWRSGTLNLPSVELFAGQEDRLWWMETALSTWIHLALWPVAVLVPALLSS